MDGRAQRDYLPSDKQMLATRGVPCVQRANQLASGVTDTVVDGEGDWTAATAVVSSSEPEQQSVVVDGAALLGGLSGMHIEYSPVAGGGGGSEAPSTHSDAELVNTAHPTGGSSGGDGDDDDDDDEFADMTQFDEDSAAVSAPSAAPAAAPATKSASGPTTLSTRTYDITITYDKYYQTPRVYFRGYDEVCSVPCLSSASHPNAPTESQCAHRRADIRGCDAGLHQQNCHHGAPPSVAQRCAAWTLVCCRM